MNKEELIGKLQMVYVGDKNALNELIGYYDGLKEVIGMVQQENADLKKQLKYLKPPLPPLSAHCSLIIAYTFLIFKETTIICFIMKE